MKRVNNKKNLYKSIILLIILAIGIGYAYLTSNLSITGATEVVANTWDIHFDNLNVTTGSVTASTPATIDSNDTSIEYAITLSRPKDFYEFTVDVKNDGTLPGKVSISTLSGLDTTSSKIIDYSIKYTNGNPVNIGDILNAGAKKTIKVRVFYKDDISESDFPSNNLNLNLTYTLQYVQSEEDAPTANSIVQDLITNNSSCFTKYEGQVTDQVGETVTANNVYYNGCVDKRHIIFNNMCWQMVRTTETGGIKIIYNGEPDNNGECGSSRGDHKGIKQPDYATSNTLDSEFLYGNGFTYDISTSEFTLTDTTTATWSDSTYENLLGKFTCKTNNNKCTTIYQINDYKSNTEAYITYYNIDNINYYSIGISSYNANYRSLANVGYMFNKVYNYQSVALTSGSLWGNDVSYSNGTYTLLPANGESTLGTNRNDKHRYTCNNTTGTCNIVRYYYHNNEYIDLDGEANIEEVINNMLYADNVNKYNSSIKGIIDNWYRQNLSNNTNMLEDTVYCNARNISNWENTGWNPNGLGYKLEFKNYSSITDLTCPNITDQFAISNNKAKLTYPVALLEEEEWNNSNNLSAIGWTISPYFFEDLAKVRTGGGNTVVNMQGIKPVVSLKNNITISEGDGSVTNPWIVE